MSTLKVITFNIYCGDPENKPGFAVADRAPRVGAVVAPYDADLIGFQEATPTWMPYLTAQYGRDYEMIYRYRSADSLETTPLLWKRARFECLKKGVFWYSDTPEQESKGWDTMGFARICMYARLRDRESGKEFTYMNTHFGFGDECQLGSAALIEQYARKLGGDRTIVTGDFNMKHTDAAYAAMTKHFGDANMMTVRDTISTTWQDWDVNHTGDLIDYCFVQGDVTPTHSERISRLVGGQFPSDHFGVYTEMTI